MKSKKIKTKKKDTESVNRKSVVDDVDPSRLTSHDSPTVGALEARFTFFTDSRFHIACLVFLILIIYANAFNAPFQWDDNEYVVNNPIVKDLHYFSSPSDAQGFEYYSAFINRYIGYLTFALNYKIHGVSVTGYHIVNIAVHIANSILIYLLVLLTFNTPFMKGIEQRAKGVALFSAAIFAAHPLQTEAVTYVFQRFASLVTFFYLLSLVMYIKARLASTTEHSRKLVPGTWYMCLSFLSAVLAMKTKENAFTLPLVITLYEFCFFRDSMKKRAWYLAPILLTLTVIPVTLMSLTGTHHLDPGAYGAKAFSQSEYFFTQFRVIVTYLRLLFFPVNQNIDYDYPVSSSFFDLSVVMSFVFLSALFGLGVYLVLSAKGKEQRVENAMPYAIGSMRLMGFGILWFFITLSVESSIIPISTIIDEYRVYLPSAGLIICVVTGAFLLPRVLLSRFTNSRRFRGYCSCLGSTFNVSRLILIALALAVGVLSIAAHERNAVWGDGIRLWEDTAQKSPSRARVHLCLGNIYQARNMFDKAAEQYLIAVNLAPEFVEAHNNLGAVYQFLKMPDKAMEQFLIAIKLKPDFAEAQLNLGIIYQTLNMPEKAIAQYMAAIKLRPDLAEAHTHLGFIYYKMGQMENARRELTTGLNINPDDQKARQLLEVVSH